MELYLDRVASQYVVISESILNREDFMYPTYQRIMGALEEVVRKARTARCGAAAASRGISESARHFYGANLAPKASDLYRYGNNIIAISGRRGQGKTSAMLSFSHAMQTKAGGDECWHGQFGDNSFLVLDPIDPTVLEASSSPLMLILSRMYRKVEEAWESYLSPGGYAGGERAITDARRNELVDLFQKCQSGILAMKAKDGGTDRSLASLHSLSDSSQLKACFYRLVDALLDFCTGGRDDGKFLVVQLDDTDFQIDKGFEVLDDIRKYLTLPNVIILMATDMDLMYKVVAQHFARELETGHQHGFVKDVEIENNARKYLDKLVPPNQIVYLPRLDHAMCRSDDRLKVRLVDADKQVLPVVGEEMLALEDTVLRFLYRKTGILCVSKKDKVHGLIPSTLRGLTQLLSLLSQLDDIPNVGEEQKESPARLAAALEERLAIKERNLSVFKDYLLNTWVDAKFSVSSWKYPASDVRRLMVRIVDDPGIDELCSSMVRVMNLYAVRWGENPQEFVVPQGKPTDPPLANLFEGIVEGSWSTNGRMDQCFIDAVNMSAALRWHKAVTRQMRSELALLENCNQAYALHLSPRYTGLTASYWFEEKRNQRSVFQEVLSNYLKRRDRADLTAIGSIIAPGSEFRVLNTVTAILSMADARDSSPLLAYGSLPQKMVYDTQEAMLVIACNPEVQREMICVEEEWLTRPKHGPEDRGLDVEAIVSKLDKLEQLIDSGEDLSTEVVSGLSENLTLIPRDLRFGCVMDWIEPRDDNRGNVLANWFSDLSLAAGVGPDKLRRLYLDCLSYLMADAGDEREAARKNALSSIEAFSVYLNELPPIQGAGISKSKDAVGRISSLVGEKDISTESRLYTARLGMAVRSICRALSFDQKTVAAPPEGGQAKEGVS